MTDSPYTEGWPKRFKFQKGLPVHVVPLSDAERLRQALDEINKQTGERWIRRLARAALNGERGFVPARDHNYDESGELVNPERGE